MSDRPRSVALYSRVSTVLQATDGMSLESQERAIREYCARQDWPEPATYVDAGRSAYKEAVRARPEFQRLLADAEAGAIDAIVVWHLNRWARRTAVTLETLQRLERAGVRLISLAQQLDYSSAVGKLTITVLAGIAQFESDEKSETTKRIRAELASQGKWGGGPPPYGARIGEDGRIAPDPAKLDALALLLDLAAQHGDATVADRLTAAGVPPPGIGYRRAEPRDHRWWPRTVNKIVKDGRWLLDQPDPWPARWLAAVNRPKQPPRPKGTTVRTLTGLMRCAACGRAVLYNFASSRRDRVPPYLQCQGTGCRRYYGYAHFHESAVLAAVAALRPLPVAARPDAPDADAWRLIAEERRRVAKLYADPRAGMGDEEYEAAMAALDERSAGLAAAGSPSRDLGGVARLLPTLAEATPEERNAVLRELIERVFIEKERRRIVWKAEVRGWFLVPAA